MSNIYTPMLTTETLTIVIKDAVCVLGRRGERRWEIT